MDYASGYIVTAFASKDDCGITSELLSDIKQAYEVAWSYLYIVAGYPETLKEYYDFDKSCDGRVKPEYAQDVNLLRSLAQSHGRWFILSKVTPYECGGSY